MLRPLLTTTAALSLSCLCLAQTDPSEGFEIYPGRNSGNNPTGAQAGTTWVVRFSTASPTYGEYLMQFDNDHFMGIGDMGYLAKNPAKPCEIHKFRVNWTDLDTATVEGFEIFVRPETAKGSKMPDMNNALFTQKVNPPPSASTRGSWSQVVQLADATTKGILTTDCVSTYFLGIDLPVLPAGTVWPNDGTAVAVSYADVSTAGGETQFDRVKGGHTSPSQYWLIGKTSATAWTRYPGFTGAVGGGLLRMVYGYSQITHAPILQVGAWHDSPGGFPIATHGVDQGYGAAGMFPDMTASRQDGVAFRITRNADASGKYGYDTWAAFAVSFGTTPQLLPTINIPPIGITPVGRLYLGLLPWMLPVSVVKLTATNADTIIKYVPPKSVPIPATMNLFFCFQAAVIGPGQPDALTNAACMRIVSP